jgi:2-hydroxychromene-2-carboxylate isomerase
MPPALPQPVFYYDLADPECYLVAERVMAELAQVPEWEPVSTAGLGLELRVPDLDELGQRVQESGLQPLRWPNAWPPEDAVALRAATYAKRVGRGVAFSLAAFRQVFAGGRDLGEEGTVLIAAAACEMHPVALLKGMGLRSVTAAMAEAEGRARVARVDRLPAIQTEAGVFTGPQCIEAAVEVVGRAALEEA